MTDLDGKDDDLLLEGVHSLPDGVWATPEVPVALREAILDRTQSVIRRRRRSRRVARVAAALVIFSLGAAAGGFLRGPSMRDGGPTTEATRSTAIDRPPLPEDPRDLVARIEAAAPDERSTLLREAGDEYLAPERADPAAALYCYRRLLADAGAVSHRGTDTWLLSFLKLARP